MLTEQVAFEGGHVLDEELFGPTIIANRQVGAAQVLLCANLEGDILQYRGQGKGVLAGGDGTVIVAYGVKVLHHITGKPSAPPLIV
jgi:hypothetical protein